MKKMITATALAAALALGLTSPSEAQSGRDVDAFSAQLRALGHQVGDVENLGAQFPYVQAVMGRLNTVIAFSGCTVDRDCDYVVFTATYNDIRQPTAEWMMYFNNLFDLAAVGQSEAGVYVRQGLVLGHEGVPVGQLTGFIDLWLNANVALADKAIQDGLVQ